MSLQLAQILSRQEDSILKEWLDLQLHALSRRPSASDERALATNSRDFLRLFRDASQRKNVGDLQSPDSSALREFLMELSASRAKEGFSPTETATFVFSLKEVLFTRLREEISDPKTLSEQIWNVSRILDSFGLFTSEAYQRTREDIIVRQQQELLELSTPVVQLWDNILALPLIGTLDSGRTQVVMQNLLDAIVRTRSNIAIIDITGVPTVDTLVAQHLLKTIAAARLMGADCIISGIRPQIAQTIIHLGVNLSDVITKATMADAFHVALTRTGMSVVRAERTAGR
jgi:rsbT co-antagonist protein RsbR